MLLATTELSATALEASTVHPCLHDMTTCTVLQARRSLEATDVAFGNGKVDGVEDGVQAADVQGAGGAAQREQEVGCRHMTHPSCSLWLLSTQLRQLYRCSAQYWCERACRALPHCWASWLHTWQLHSCLILCHVTQPSYLLLCSRTSSRLSSAS
jgi:hypothetical protein